MQLVASFSGVDGSLERAIARAEANFRRWREEHPAAEILYGSAQSGVTRDIDWHVITVWYVPMQEEDKDA